MPESGNSARIAARRWMDNAMSKQLDIFGGESEAKAQPRASERRYKRMQELHGAVSGKTCKTCKHLLIRDYHGRRYFKCELWIVSGSQATDIRLRDTACGKYEEDKQ